MKEISATDWIYSDGEVHFQRRFYENLIKTRPDFAERVIAMNPKYEKQNNLNQKLLNENIHYMQERGGAIEKVLNADVNGALNIVRKSSIVDVSILYSRGEVDTQ